jgi:putative membrane-bound dehydrogenase-like protein
MTIRLLALTPVLLALASGSRLTAADAKPADRPIPPKDAAKAMTVPAGFKVTLFAGEPDVVQPIAMTFDDRGRLWVVECLSYPNWRADGKGVDRVVILEDTDGDGTFDKKTVFLDNGSNLSGIELGFGGVWLCSLPNLIFIPIKDGEDKPAGPPEIVLDGWNLKDTKHNVFNSLAWGPDGWLYGCNGIQAKSLVGKPGTRDKDRVFLDCGVWRYHPTRKVFEAYAWGTTNPFGLDWDDYGQMFITNCVIDHLWHVVPGGHYQRMYGDDPNPHVYGYMKSCCDHLHWGGGSWTASRSTGVGGSPQHSAAGGGHAHSGCAVYLGDNFPAEYRNSVFMCNIHGNRLNRDRLERSPAGYVGKHAPDFLFANDSWFRGLCVKCGPDGGLYVSDWCDTGECHNYDKADVTNGRIYRVVYGTPKRWTGDVSKLSDAELVKLQLHPNDWFVRHARRVLQERAAAGKLERGTADGLRAILRDNPTVTRTLRALWALHCSGELTTGDLNAILKHPDDHLRAWGVLLSTDRWATHSELPPGLDRLVAEEQSPFVLTVLAGASCRLREEWCADIAKRLVKRLSGPADSDLMLMLWYAVQRGLSYPTPQDWFWVLWEAKSDAIRRRAARYIVSSVAADRRKKRVEEIVGLMLELGRTDRDASILAGIQDGLAGLREFPEPGWWKSVYPDLVKSESPDVRNRAEALAVLFGNEQAIRDLTARIGDSKAAAGARVAAVELLARRQVTGLAPVLQVVLTDPAVRGAAVRALAAYPDADTPAAILKHYASFTAAEKADAVQTLASRPAFAAALLDAVGKEQIPRTDVSVVAARQVLALNDKALATRLEKVWGTIRPASKERTAAVKKWKGVLTAEALKAADASHGRAVFAQHCATCHKLFGEGTEFGPDLTGSQRANLDYVLENVLDPSAVVPREFRVTNFTLTDGRVVGGTVLRETPDGVTVRTTNETVVIATRDIESRKPTSQSIMPDGLFDKLKPEEVRDLVAYLAAREQVPLPKKN